MVKFDLSKLRGRIAERGLTQTEFAKQMGWSNAGCSYRFNGTTFLKQTDIAKAIEILEIPTEEVVEYFFKEL